MAGEQADRGLALAREPGLHPVVGDGLVDEADDDLDDPLGALLVDLPVDIGEKVVGEVPDHLHQELLTRADPAVEGDPIDPELASERGHVDALAGAPLVPCEPEGVAPPGTHGLCDGAGHRFRGPCRAPPSRHDGRWQATEGLTAVGASN